MPESSPTIMTTREASILAQNLVSYTAGGRSIATPVATLERDARIAARLILALMRHAHPSDVFRLPPEG
jgi:hypothetical protein